MENTFSEADMAMLLLDQKDLVHLGAILGLQARFGTQPEEATTPTNPLPLEFDA
ncbi:MAG: hypothetical protein P8K76_13220 [Candidatus Binatia bacterium]|jgi:hypothetical protein|nr:hypothetical protein [Candidatus Binatia bacterium]MDG2010728.1 hypothetical protein [Candidatus Binatia bacterium]